MGNHTEVFYHFVWATKRREPFLTPKVEPLVHDFIRYKCRLLKVAVHAVNGMPDHVHLACSLPLSRSASDFLETIKGTSSHFINHKPELRDDLSVCLYWQPGVGALTFAGRDLARIVRYIDNQKTRHAAGTVFAAMEQSDDGYGRPEEETGR